MTTSKVKDGILGFVVGDALGIYNEFKSRECLKDNLLTEMKGFGSHPVPAGSWSDDSSSILATIDSINTKQLIDYNDIANNLVLWLKEAKYTPFNYVFDVDFTTLKALTNFREYNIDATRCGLKGIEFNDNGSLMRMLPYAYYAYYKQLKDSEILDIVKNASYITHKNDICVLGCYIYVRYVICLLGGKNKEKSYNLIKSFDYSEFSVKSLKVYHRILNNDISLLKLKEIKSSAYIVDTLEASLWCLLKSKSYMQAVIAAVNLGDDTDTIGALTGSLAGIIYGYKSIPEDWVNKIINLEYILNITKEYEKTLKEKNLYKQLSLMI